MKLYELRMCKHRRCCVNILGVRYMMGQVRVHFESLFYNLNTIA